MDPLRRAEIRRAEVQEKLIKLDAEIKEHNLVLKALENVDPERRCFRMVGTVMVPRTAKEIKPALEKNVAKISELMSTLATELENCNAEVAALRSV